MAEEVIELKGFNGSEDFMDKNKREVFRVEGIMSKSLDKYPSRFIQPGKINANLDASVFKICKVLPYVIAAGGCVASTINYQSEFFDLQGLNSNSLASDLDLYVPSSNTEEAASHIKSICEYLKPVGDVVMSRYAVSMYVSKRIFSTRVLSGNCTYYPVIRAYLSNIDGDSTTKMVDDDDEHIYFKVQIIAHHLSGNIFQCLQELFSHYDLPCCKFATNGRSFFATRSAVETTFRTRVNRVPWAKMVSERRIAKYYKKFYDFVVLGPDGKTEIEVHPRSVGMNSIREALDKSSVADCTKQETAVKWLSADEDLDTCYVLKQMVTSNKNYPMWVLDLSFDCFMDGKPLPELVCGNASTDTEYIIRTGRTHINKATDWMYMRMNRFCEELCARGEANKFTSEDMIKARSDFANKIDQFMDIIKNHSIPPFMHAGELFYENNTDFEAFRRHWMEPAPEIAVPTDKKGHKRSAEEILVEACVLSKRQKKKSDAESPAAVINYRPCARMASFRFSNQSLDNLCIHENMFYCSKHGNGYIAIPKVSLSGESPSSLVVYTPKLHVPGVFVFNPPNPATMLLCLCPFREKWENDAEMVAFKLYMDSVQRHIVELLYKNELIKERPGATCEQDINDAFTPIMESRPYIEYPLEGESFVKTYPPAMQAFVPDIYNKRPNMPASLLIMEKYTGLVAIDRETYNTTYKTSAEATVMLNWIYIKTKHKKVGLPYKTFSERYSVSTHWSIINAVFHQNTQKLFLPLQPPTIEQ